MTAPAAPSIVVHTDGVTARVGWRAVPTAADYRLSVNGVVIATIADDGERWFQHTLIPVNPADITLTARNLAVEESAASNTVGLSLGGPGRSLGSHADPFGNDR